MLKLYIAVLDEVCDFMVPTLVAHSVLAAHIKFEGDIVYQDWLKYSFRKVVLRVNQKEFDKIALLEHVHLGHENKTLDGKKSCAVVCPIEGELPNVLKFAKMWKPKIENHPNEILNQAIDALIFAYDACDSEWVKKNKLGPLIEKLDSLLKD